jgi:hypothetical protein
MINRATHTAVRSKDVFVQNNLSHEDDAMLEQTLQENLKLDAEN